MHPRRVGFLGFDGVNALDIIGPLEAFATAAVDDGSGARRRCYEVVVIGLADRPFASESGVVFEPNVTLQTAPRLDTLIVPGGGGLREPGTNARVAAWLKAGARRIRRVASVCTGIYGLAPTGLLDGRRVTTHWRFARDLAASFPRLKVEGDALFIKDGSFYTSAGITAGIDLSLALIEEDHGAGVSLAVARELVMYVKRPGGQEQYSEPLRFQVESSDRFSELAVWMLAHLDRDLSVATLAGRAHLSPRHFSRAFRDTFGSAPAALVEELRLAEARRRLSARNRSVGGVAVSVGFRSTDAFRRAFQRRFGVTPSSYRSRFSPP